MTAPQAQPSPDLGPCATPGHIHRWRLDSPARGSILGRCACGEERTYPADPPRGFRLTGVRGSREERREMAERLEEAERGNVHPEAL